MSISEIELSRRIVRFIYRVLNLSSNKTSPRWIIFMFDVLISMVGVALAFALRMGFEYFTVNLKVVGQAALLVAVIRSFFFIFFKVYSHIVRYTSIHDIKKVAQTNTWATIVIIASVIIARKTAIDFTIPMSIVMLEYFFTMVTMVILRLLIRFVYKAVKTFDLDKKNVIIVGSNELAALLKETLDLTPRENYQAVAFVDSDIPATKKKLAGLELHFLSELSKLVEEREVEGILIAKNDMCQEEKNTIAKVAKEHGVKIHSIPDLWYFKNTGQLSMEEVNMEELLHRDPIKLSKEHIRKDLTGKTILITGAAGSIGSELVRQIATYNPSNLILLDQAESPLYDIELELRENIGFTNYTVVLADIVNKSRIEKVFDAFQPEVVYHAAAYKHVPMMEQNPLEAFENNVLGSRNLADMSHKYGVKKFVMVSTDKAVNPTGIMGATKRMAEIYIQSLNKHSKTAFITTRFGNVLNSNGSVIPRFIKQIKEGGPVTVTHADITRFFMTIPEACQLVLEASVMGKGGEVFLFDMGEPVKILDLAKNLIESAGLEVGKDIEIVFTGLRPGEKLYEELLLDAEDNRPTHHPKIKIATVMDHNYEEIKAHYDRCNFPIESQNITELVKLMKEAVPTYKSNNSVFEKLDSAV